MSEKRKVEFTPARVVGRAGPEVPDWYDLSVPRETYRVLGYLASFWQVSRENALLLLLRAVQFGEWPGEGQDIMTDPAAYQEWAIRVQRRANTLVIPGIGGRPDPALQLDRAEWWAAVEAEREQLARAELFCRRCYHLREGRSGERADGLCEDCGDEADDRAGATGEAGRRTEASDDERE